MLPNAIYIHIDACIHVYAFYDKKMHLKRTRRQGRMPSALLREFLC